MLNAHAVIRRLCGSAVLVGTVSGLWAQQQPSAEYIRLGGRVIAIERPTPPIVVTVTGPGGQTSVPLTAGQTAQFDAVVTGTTNAGVTWSISPAVGQISQLDSDSATYTAPATINQNQTVTVTATSVADGTKTGSATVQLTAAVAVAVAPTTFTVVSGGAQSFTATVTGTTNTAVTWTVTPPSAGTINSSGVFQSASGLTSNTPATIRATSVADSTKWAEATGTVTVNVGQICPLSRTSVTVENGGAPVAVEVRCPGGCVVVVVRSELGAYQSAIRGGRPLDNGYGRFLRAGHRLP